MTREEHKALIADVIARAAKMELCDVVVIGVLPDGGGLYTDWSGTTINSLVLQLDAAKAEAIRLYLAGLKGEEMKK